MPKQNRVTPAGTIVAVPERGTFMGNRGILHNSTGSIVRAWQGKRWLVCVLEFRGRKREVMSPGRYTELFFLDEATALAAGHRPCAECRRERFRAFQDAWCLAVRGGERPTADQIDERLHAERLGPRRSKRTFEESLDDLPDAVFVQLHDSGEQPWLVQGSRLLAWSPGGYQQQRRRPRSRNVTVLTPPSTVAAIRAGYAPEVHASATGP
jgi:hypothetical protein